MALDWAAFERLDGSPDTNLEALCRAIVQRNYGRCGRIWSLRQQPGVEFHMELEQSCDLGDAGRWFGWQCRWYQLRSNNQFTSAQRSSIEDAIRKAKKHIPGLTDFVLCLRELPAKSDVDWYKALDTPLRLSLWAEEALEALLTGDAAILRATFFGELVLTNATLADAHRRAVARVEQRWVPDLHVVTSVERDLQLALARPGSASALAVQAERLDRLASSLEASSETLADAETSKLARQIAGDARSLAERIAGVAHACDHSRASEARELAGDVPRPNTSVAEVKLFARRMRSLNVPASLDASAVEAEMKAGFRLLRHARNCLAAEMFAVVGDAGRGKSHLGAQLTASTELLPAGIFIVAGDLRAGATLDDLAARVPGLGIQSFDRLLEAVDAAGARAGARIPIVMDGLNESVRPLEWEGLLASLRPALARSPNVLLIVTLRTSLKDDVLPTNTPVLALEWPEWEVWALVEQYFEHYLIHPGSARLPIYRFRDPLFLWMYCEAANSERAHPVGVESLPESLVGVFSLYRDRAADRLRKRFGSQPGYIERQLAKIALELWTRNARRLPFTEVQRLVDEEESEWEHSLVRALEEEGILWRHDPSAEEQESAILFDAFGGYLVADALLRECGLTQAQELLASQSFWSKLVGDPHDRHPLAGDIHLALAGVVPRLFYHEQLWKLAPDEARPDALRQTLWLESELLDPETIKALLDLVAERSPAPTSRGHFFDRLWDVRDGVAHRLNAHFLDSVLRLMPLATRDLRWSEWSRLRLDELLEDVAELDSVWSATATRSESDDLAAVALSWLLTSTVTKLRDRATRALQRYGAPDPGRLFDLTVRLLDGDDLYVTERLLAASYGAATRHQMPDPGGPFEGALAGFLEALAGRYLGDQATTPTSHALVRHYIAGLFEFAQRLHASAVPTLSGAGVMFRSGPEPPALPAGDEAAAECDEIFYGPDFQNYVVGGLYPGRGNYDFKHAGYQAGIADIRRRVGELGWRLQDFASVDRQIAESSWRRNQEHGDRTERYGKKYGWIAYHELAGRLADRGEARERSWGIAVWPDIDPTFPSAPARLKLELQPWAGAEHLEAEEWIRTAPIDLPPGLLVPETVESDAGPWVLVEGHASQRNAALGRRAFGFIRALLVDASEIDALLQIVSDESIRIDLPEVPSDNATYAGEIPWSERFAAELYEEAERREEGSLLYRSRVRREWGEAGVAVELVAHGYSFSADRTSTTLPGVYHVPSKALAALNELRLRPPALDLVQLDGRRASLTRRPPDGFDGHLLYLRKDLLRDYANGRRLVQVAWGERQLDQTFGAEPEWMRKVWDERADDWRRVAEVDLS